MELFSLIGKTALITGSSQGIGYALAEGLARAGATVILNGRDKKKLSKSVRNLQKIYPSTLSLSFDVTNYNEVKQSIESYFSKAKKIDILVNNAGMQHRAPLEDFPLEKFEKLIQTNVSSVFNVGQIIAKRMLKSGGGKIINIASVHSKLARSGVAPYIASKGAVENLTKGMATEWASKGIQVNAIGPGYFSTPLTADLANDPEFNKWLQRRTPAGRWGELEELVGTCIFLASSASNFVNGQIIFVDGGLTISL